MPDFRDEVKRCQTNMKFKDIHDYERCEVDGDLGEGVKIPERNGYNSIHFYKNVPHGVRLGYIHPEAEVKEMRYCECLEEAWHLVADVPMCLSCFDEKYTEDLMAHGKTCKCRGCKEKAPEIEKYLQMMEGGQIESWMRGPRNPYAEREYPF